MATRSRRAVPALLGLAVAVGAVLALARAVAGDTPGPALASSAKSTSTTAATVLPTTLPPVVTTLPVSTTRPAATTSVPVTAPSATTAPRTVPRTFVPPVTRLLPTTAPTSTTSTTIAGIVGQVPSGPVTLPLLTKGTNGHVDPVFAWLSGAGFAVVLLFVGFRLLMTRAGGRDRAPYHDPAT